MNLTYEAVDAAGRQKRDTLKASSPKHAVEQLRRQGLYVKSITETGKPKRTGAAHARPDAELRIPLKSVVIFTRQMAMLLRAGSGMVQALSAIRRQSKKPALTAMINSIIADLEDGATLTEALRRFPLVFDPVYCAVVAAGEASATIAVMFERLAEILGKRRALRNKVIGTMVYPALLVTMCMGIIVTLLTFVIPRFADMFVQLGVEPPPSTKMLLAVADGLRSYWPFLILALVVTGGAVVFSLASKRGRQIMANWQTAIPLLGRLRTGLIQGQVLRTLGTLLESRVGVLDALELVRGSTRNRRFQKLFDDVEQSVTSGGHLGTTFERSGLIDPYVCQAIITGEESGNMGPAMTYAAEMLEESNTEVLHTVMKLVEPVILIGMGVVVGTVAVSLFVPLFDLTSAMR